MVLFVGILCGGFFCGFVGVLFGFFGGSFFFFLSFPATCSVKYVNYSLLKMMFITETK